jgi:hypothetical protein
MTYILHQTDAEGLYAQRLKWNRGDYQNLITHQKDEEVSVDDSSIGIALKNPIPDHRRQR